MGMTWKECVDKGIIIRTDSDVDRACKMHEMAKLRGEFWNQKIGSKFVSLRVEAFYEIIKELIYAHMYRNGFNCRNHLCLIAYLKEKFDDFDFEIDKIDELRRVRNEINYRGSQVSNDYFLRNELELKNIIDLLTKNLLIYCEF